MSTISDGLTRVREALATAVARRGAGPLPVLIGVSKRQSTAAIRSAAAANLEDIGENYAQEMSTKRAELDGLVTAAGIPVRWHFIGAVQSNKVKLVQCSLVHGVDRASAAAALGKAAVAAGRVQDVLVQVNLAAEASKRGVHPAAAPGLLDDVQATPGLRLRGLMLIPPAGDAAATRRWFRALRALRDDLARRLSAPHELTELSMGMSADFEVAVEEGATLLRVGTAIFGERG